MESCQDNAKCKKEEEEEDEAEEEEEEGRTMENELMSAILGKEPRERLRVKLLGKPHLLPEALRQDRNLSVNLRLRSGGRICLKEPHRA